MMEEHGDRKQAETLPMEGSSPKEVPGIVRESHIREENAALSEPSGTEKFPERIRMRSICGSRRRWTGMGSKLRW